jgi:NAD(P)-dependent dehydrogenase (short-subunit alcohol dehydrogenase family)
MPHDLLKDRVALVTGAGQGLGAAVAREFAAEGAAVALVEINSASVTAVEAEIRSNGGRAQAYPLDITDYAAYQRAMDDVVARWGKLDILVNNAAIAFYATILDDTLEDWRKQIAVNLEAVYMGSKMAAPIMVRQGGGRIISVTSVQGFVSSGMCGAYNAAKGGIIALTKSMAVELAPYHILVNAVAPGFMLTPMSIVDGVDETTTPGFQDWYVAQRKIPMARTGYPEDDAGAAVFLASEYCRYMTGQVLVVDGGLTSTF